MTPRVLIVDDEADIRELLDMTLARMGLECDSAASVAEAKRLLRERAYQLCLTDMRMPDGDGLELVREIEAHYPTLPVAVITAHGSTENAVAALKAGAFDYLAKPVSLAQLRTLVKSALAVPESKAGTVARCQELLGRSPPIVQVRELIAKVAKSEAPVYISGESGSGKELAARLIHQGSRRRDEPFIAVNCGAIPENLMESEFFGYRKGAFTGADSEREGFFQAADGGTLFLDEVADLPLPMQVKLLRAIQEKHVRRVGATTEEPVNVRIICATHQDLRQLMEAGRFRQDLFFRLNVIEIHMPALRECREDVAEFAQRILERLATASGLPVPRLTSQAMAALMAYDFPGNVRELENILERALALHGGDVIDSEDLQLQPPKVGGAETAGIGGKPLQEFLDEQERQAILDALQKTRYNRTAAARLLGVTFRSLRYRMERLGLNETSA
ncbi:MAG: sigma-54-dependent transcriptional regulator [Pseudomonadota bacterium]|uniref:sigma-54-dependent transcriptional regulator n=1 Tax=Sulfuricystis thermophila TaxID=2496847 RepID=UPI00103561B8|nr:sigma-54 dependent transcriptional regulator [Sulfuricystis thermophila]